MLAHGLGVTEVVMVVHQTVEQRLITGAADLAKLERQLAEAVSRCARGQDPSCPVLDVLEGG